jgi:hypothetical protein
MPTAFVRLDARGKGVYSAVRGQPSPELTHEQKLPGAIHGGGF